MKTEQEQIEAIKQIIDERVETTLGQVQGRHGNVIKTVDTVIIARDIIEAGYGDVSEHKAEIERLKAEIERLKAENKSQERENGFLKYCQCLTHGVDGSSHIKKAQIDVLNKAKEKLDSAPNGWAYTNYIDELIEEIENDK